MYKERIIFYEQLEKEFNSKVLLYVTSDRVNMETVIAHDVIEYFIRQLDNMGVVKKISLILYTRGGNTSAAWSIINLIRMYCDELQVIIPHNAHSAGTIIALGANEIVMTKQATLGPIDPSINTPLNPLVPNGMGNTLPVSVEAVKGYLEYAKNEIGIKDDQALAQIFNKLSEHVHPLVLGQVYRSRAQIQMLAEKLVVYQISDSDKKKKLIDFLCSDSGSHDYTINRREAKGSLGLNVIKPTEKQYEIINNIYKDFSEELEFNKMFNPQNYNGEFVARRGLLESINGGSDYYITEGVIRHIKHDNGEISLQTMTRFDGWRHEDEEMLVEKPLSEDEEVNYEKVEDFQM